MPRIYQTGSWICKTCLGSLTLSFRFVVLEQMRFCDAMFVNKWSEGISSLRLHFLKPVISRIDSQLNKEGKNA